MCYGDSNTYGVKDDRSGRYGEAERWPGILHSLLGANYRVIEEGLPGRTTDLDHPNPNKPGRNGWDTFPDCLRRHAPVDVLILMLGTNDLKVIYDRTPDEVADALVKFVEYSRTYHSEASLPMPKVILVSPPWMDDEAPEFEASMPTPGIYDHDSVVKSRRLAETIERVARSVDCSYFDSAQVARTGIDGCHMDQKSHVLLADSLLELIQEN